MSTYTMLAVASAAQQKYSPDRSGFHDYTAGPNEVCSEAQACSAGEIKDQLSSFAVPGQDPSRPVENLGIYPVTDPRLGLPTGNVLTTVSPNGLTIINTTLPGHVFHDGQITRSASQGVNGAWSVTTRGIGNNVIPGAATINQWQGPAIFNNLDAQMRANIGAHR